MTSGICARAAKVPARTSPAAVMTPPVVDVAILSINGLPHVAQQLEEVFELWVNHNGSDLGKMFSDVATVPLKDRVHDEFPEIITVQPGLVEPVTFDRDGGEVAVGEVRVR